MKAQFDLLLVTVTRVEGLAVLGLFQQHTGQTARPEPRGDRTYQDLGVVNGARVWLVLSGMGAGGPEGAQQAVSKAIAAIRPAAVVMVGIAFGLDPERQALGDILVAENLRLYEPQRVGTAGGKPSLVPRGDRPHASPWLLNAFRTADLHWQGARVRFGCVLTGEKLVDNLDLRAQLRALEPEALGGEMEGAGLYVACQDAKVDWLLVKAICDWADGEKEVDRDVRQQRAAENAAKYVLHTLQRIALRPPSGLPGQTESSRMEAGMVTPPLATLLAGPRPDREFATLVQRLVVHQGRMNGFTVEVAPDNRGGACWLRQGGILGLKGFTCVAARWLQSGAALEAAAGRELVAELEGRDFPSHGTGVDLVLVFAVSLSEEQVRSLRQGGTDTAREVRLLESAECLEWLRDCPPLLARYLPQAAAQLPQATGFSGRALKALCAEYRALDLPRHRDLRLIGVSTRLAQQRYDAGTIPLNEVFVPQKFIPVGQTADQAKDLENLLLSPGPKVLLGDPGCGKTTVLHYLALRRGSEAGGEEGAELPPVPFFLSLRDFARDRKERPTVVEALAEQARLLGMGRGDAHPWFFQGLLEMGEAVVLLDGLDEAGDESSRTQIARLLEAFHRDYPLCPLWVTTRLVGYSGTARLEPKVFSHFQVAAFGPAERRAFVNKWFAAEFPDRAAERDDHAQTLLRALDEALPQVQELAGNPLLLTLMVLIHRQRQHLPESRGELYDEAIEMLLHQREKDRFKGEPTPLEKLQPPIEVNEARWYLTSLAWAAQKANETKEAKERGDIPRRLILDELTPLRLPKRGGDRNAAQADIEVFLEYIQARTGLLNWRGQETYAFAHLSFQEHLAARQLADDDEQTPVGKCDFFFAHAGAPAWRETALLLLYRMQRSTSREPFLDRLMSQARRREEGGQRLDLSLWRTLGMALRDGLNFLGSDATLILETLLADWLAAPQFEGETHAVLAQIAIFAKPCSRSLLLECLERCWRGKTAPAVALAAIHLRVRLLGWPTAALEESERLAAELAAFVATAQDPPKDRPWLERAGLILADAGPSTVAAHPLGARCLEAVRARLEALLTQPSLSAPERVQSGVVLARLGDQRAGVGLKAGLPDLDWIEIPPGPFVMGSKPGETSFDDEQPQFQCALITQPYGISRYPVTVAQYRAFVDAGGYGEEARRWWTQAGWEWKQSKRISGPEDYAPIFQTPNHPRVGVSWYEAVAFCRWLSERWQRQITLPTEVQWERAARHTDARAYPWGPQKDNLAQRCNMGKTGLGHTSAVGLFPNGLAECGAADMSGNVWDWTRSLWGKPSPTPDFRYPYNPADGREDLEAGADIWRVLRGGSWILVNPEGLRCAYRVIGTPDGRNQSHGFRCVVGLGGSAPR